MKIFSDLVEFSTKILFSASLWLFYEKTSIRMLVLDISDADYLLNEVNSVLYLQINICSPHTGNLKLVVVI